MAEKPTILNPSTERSPYAKECPNCGRAYVDSPTKRHLCGISDQGMPLRFREPIDPRAIKRQHRWKLGHEPDAKHPDSGWVTLDLDVTESTPTPPDQKTGLGGGPESGFPCQTCGYMTRIVARKPPSRIIGDSDMFEVDKDKVRIMDEDSVLLLACGRCDSTIQIRESILRRLRRHKLGVV